MILKKYLKYILNIILALIILAAGIAIGYFLGYRNETNILNNKFDSIRPLRDASQSYKFIDPLLLYLIPSNDQQKDIVLLKNKVLGIIDSGKESGNLSDASVYFQDLSSGKWFGVNQNDQYNPASMLKVVIMVSYFKDSENNQEILNQNLVYSTDINNLLMQDPYDTSSSLIIGNSYNVNDLINKMIIDSDNGAAYLLLSNISTDSLDSVYNVLDIPSPDSTKDTFTISPRYYSFFFRILYNATYLDNADSEKALNILSQATFADGIVAGLPKDVVVSHKYGEYVVHQGNQVQQVELHDCGIVYHTKSPYLLCIMTKGNNLDNLKSAIKNISSTVYQDYSNIK